VAPLLGRIKTNAT